MKKVNNILKMISQMDANANEVKLAKHEVELGLVDDLKAEINKSLPNVLNSINELYADANKLKTLFEGALKQKSDIEKRYESNKKLSADTIGKLNNQFDAIKKMSKELGIDVATIPAYKEYLNSRKQLEDTRDKIQSAWNLVANF
jgi:chromosome segregation ATPase